MKTHTKVWIGVGVVVLLVVLWMIGGYNRFVGLDQSINGAWGEVNNQYTRQAELIPNLVSTVASAARVETSFVERVTASRTRWLEADASGKDAAGVTMNADVAALVRAISTAENYPLLQANKQYTQLMDELAGTQNRITVARGSWIALIKDYNIAIKRFPANLLAGMFGFEAKTYYEAPAGTTTPLLGTGVLP